MPTVQSIQARWVLDSRGLPTVSCSVILDHQGVKYIGSASVPSGASTGTYEALELRDNGEDFHGKGVSVAVGNINNSIHEALYNKNFASALELDQFLLSIDTSSNKSELGANAILAVSMASHRAYAQVYGLELWQYLRRMYFSILPAQAKFPRLMCNVINGGAHADSGLDIQEFMIVPNTGEIEKDIQCASEIYHSLKKKLSVDIQSTSLGDEGGFAPNLTGTPAALTYLQDSIESAGYTKVQCQLAMDCAANEYYNAETNTYHIDGKDVPVSELIDMYKKWSDEFDIISIEDGCQEDDLVGWELLTKVMGQKRTLIGDDLFVTNTKRFEEIGLANSIANGVLIKLNQIGSVSETADIINKAKENNYATAVSHRSGETTDDFISDLAFASQSEFIKLGAPARGERVAKYNRLLEINDSLN